MLALITGTSGGIGSAIAKYFLRQGWDVCGLDTAPAVIMDSRYRHYIADVRDPDSFPEGIEPEVVINCAGVQNTGHDIDVNLKGAINISERYAIGNDQLRSVVNIGSASAHTGSEFPEYAASKGGLLTYTKTLALRLAPQAICNSIDPGGVMTDLNRCVIEDEALWNQIMELTPLKRWAEPEEIAEWVYFVGVTNRFMTGQNLLIDGGEAGNAKFIWREDETV
ncbi:MAG: SDR family oxidoreductase [Bacillota bacterium]|nr:SDR family oxidoreductase [Bacillota bacterium]